MTEIRLFRFDVKIDVTSYLKPYFYQNLDFTTIRELLIDIQKNDPYFDFHDTKFCKINDIVVSLDENLETFKNENELIITPLYEAGAYKDLNSKFDTFEAKFKAFEEFKNEKDFYDTLLPYFYATKVPKFSPNFLGNSAFIFAKYLIEKYQDKKDKILTLIESQMPYFTPCKALNLEYDDGNIFEYFKDVLSYKTKNFPLITSETEIQNLKHNFKNFNIAVYDGENNENDLKNLVIKLGGNVLVCGFERDILGDKIYQIDKECALRLGGEILFGAFDAGADFLVVNSQDAFDFLDGKSSEIQRSLNRYLNNFYILKSDEFLTLAQGKKPDSLKNHKLEVTLI